MVVNQMAAECLHIVHVAYEQQKQNKKHPLPPGARGGVQVLGEAGPVIAGELAGAVV